MMAFQTLQRQFLAHCRDPGHQPLPDGFAEQGAATYVDLLYNKFNDSLELCFPVTRALLGETAWRQLLQAFIAEHRCQSPYYRKIPDEFIRYLQTERISESDPVYLLELAHFEWVEMALAITESVPVTASILNNVFNWLVCRPLFVPIFELLIYNYPVQRINVDNLPMTVSEQTTHILGFRDANEVVQFIELQPATARLLDVLRSTGCTVCEAIALIAKEIRQPEPSVLFDFGIEAINQLVEQGVIIGVKDSIEKDHE